MDTPAQLSLSLCEAENQRPIKHPQIPGFKVTRYRAIYIEKLWSDTIYIMATGHMHIETLQPPSI